MSGKLIPEGLVAALLRRPSLLAEAVRASLALAPRGWWRRRPFLPVPDEAYVSWRAETAYGRKDAPLVVDDVVHYLEWRRGMRRVRSLRSRLREHRRST